ncbi:MAG TPA: CDP-glucose 4,6-dehydratase [Planctomycetes bacterium]|nr:CDP-glucose 4,6-dehydratase [Planctomycetaceae bacterium]HIM30415.1 CDP-glucose 4,6-dehydratase [Planctomycetota bacterium]
MTSALDRAFYGRSVFVTGHTGFKGSWLCLWLERLGARITGYALQPPTDPSNFDVCGVRDVLDHHHEDDIRDEAKLHAAMRKANPDVVLHLAAQSVVRRGYESPRETFDINVMGTINVLEGVRKLDKPCAVVCVTSDKCYENREQVWGYREQDAMGEHDPYGGSKGAAELAIRSYRQSFFDPARIEQHGIKLASGRAGNVIGGGDWTSHALIVDVVKAIANGNAVRLRSPLAFRPWQHVLQALSGYLLLAARLLESDDPVYCSGWNFGPVPGNELPVQKVVEAFCDRWGSGSWIDESDPTQPHEATILRLSIDKALWQLGWRPGWDVHETLSHTAEWYRHYFDDPNSIRDFTFQQINTYCVDQQSAAARGDLAVQQPS